MSLPHHRVLLDELTTGGMEWVGWSSLKDVAVQELG